MKRIKYILCMTIAILTMFISIASGAVFSDVLGHKDEAYITEYSTKGYVTGYPDKTFKPDNTITRAEVVTLLEKFNLYEYNKTNINFTDVFYNDWFYEYINSAVKSGVVSGYEGNTFKPNNNITRFEAISIISNFVRSDNYNSVQLPYNDTEKIPLWVNNAVRNLYGAGIISDYDNNTINGNEYITRAEVIRMIAKLMEKYDWDTSKIASTTLESATNPLPQSTEIAHDILGYLTIESININEFPIKDGADLVTIKTAIGHFSETPIWDGNVGFCAHNRDYKYDFRNLKNIEIGDTVTYESHFGTRNYKVTVIKPIEETDWSDIVKETEVNTVTMVTCIEEQPTKRLLVQAVQIE